MSIQSINPYTGKEIKIYKETSLKQIIKKIDDTQNAWQVWKHSTFEERAHLLENTASVLYKRKKELARLMALEMGKPVKHGMVEIEKCALACDYYAKNAWKILKDEPVTTDAGKSFISFQPLGIVLAIMPWNFPFWQVFRFLAPSLMAGNCALLKHASNVPGCALAIEDIILEAGYPDFVFQTLLIKGKQVSKVIESPYIKAVTLTGSTDAGIQVAQKSASLLKKTVLELGGSDAYIILEDADLELAAQACADSRLNNGGQSCISAKRFIVVKQVEKEFIKLFKKKMADKVIGDPLEESTEMGPMARIDLRDQLHEQVMKSIAKGAKCILGGKVPKGEGAFYCPTILTRVKKGMPAYDEELFGPVAAVISAKDEAHAISIANDSPFGLGAAVFTKNIKRGEEIAANHLDAGSCFVNAFVKSDVRLPFGGIKQSGYGRELGTYGIKEFVNIKTVFISS